MLLFHAAALRGAAVFGQYPSGHFGDWCLASRLNSRMSAWAMRICSRSIQTEWGKPLGLAPRSLAGRSWITSSNLACAPPPAIRYARFCLRSWSFGPGMWPPGWAAPSLDGSHARKDARVSGRGAWGGTRAGGSGLRPTGETRRRPPGFSFLARGGGGRREVGHGVADRVAGKDQLNPAVLLPPFRSVVGSDGRVFAEAASFNRSRGNSLLHEVVAHRIGPALGKALVIFVAADAVGVAFDGDVQAGISQDDAGD